jgi:hypothetical protein
MQIESVTLTHISEQINSKRSFRHLDVEMSKKSPNAGAVPLATIAYAAPQIKKQVLEEFDLSKESEGWPRSVAKLLRNQQSDILIDS